MCLLHQAWGERDMSGVKRGNGIKKFRNTDLKHAGYLRCFSAVLYLWTNRFMWLCDHWLFTKHTQLLAHSIWVHPSESRGSASFFEHYTKAFNRKHVLHKTSYLNPSPNHLRTRKSIRSFRNCYQLLVHTPHQSLQLSNNSFLHLVHNHQAATSPEMLGFSSTVCGPYLVTLQPARKQWACEAQICVLLYEELTQKKKSAHNILHDCIKFEPPCHIWHGQSYSLEISCQIKVQTNMHLCCVCERNFLKLILERLSWSCSDHFIKFKNPCFSWLKYSSFCFMIPQPVNSFRQAVAFCPKKCSKTKNMNS